MIQVLLICIACMGLFAGFQTWRVAVCKADFNKLQGSYLVVTEKAAEQSAAVARWEEAANARSKAGQIARAQAQAEVAKSAGEVNRLNGLLAASRAPVAGTEPPKDCKDAVAEVRKGLK